MRSSARTYIDAKHRLWLILSVWLIGLTTLAQPIENAPNCNYSELSGYPVDWPISDVSRLSWADIVIATKGLQDLSRRTLPDAFVYYTDSIFHIESQNLAYWHEVSEELLIPGLSCAVADRSLVRLIAKPRRGSYDYMADLPTTDLKSEFYSDTEIDLFKLWASILEAVEQGAGVELDAETESDTERGKKISSKWIRYDMAKPGFVARERIEISMREQRSKVQDGTSKQLGVRVTVDSKLYYRRASARNWIPVAQESPAPRTPSARAAHHGAVRTVGNAKLVDRTHGSHHPVSIAILDAIKAE